MPKPTYYIREWRLIAGLSQVELAENAGLNRQSIVGHETGLYTPTKETAGAIAKALGVSVDSLRKNPLSRFPSYWKYRTKE